MPKKEKKDTKEEPAVDMQMAQVLTEAIADIMNNTIHNYWLSARDAKSATAECFKTLQSFFKVHIKLAYRIFDGALMVNGSALREKSHNIEIFIKHLTILEIDNFTLFPSVSEKEFFDLLEILEAQPFELEQLGGFASCLEKFKIENIETKKLIFKEVSEEEVVVSKDMVGSGKEDGDGTGEEKIGSILAFLKGDIPTDDKNAIKNIQETANDSAKMAELILQAAEVRQSQANLEGGESMVDFVVGCLRRTYDGMTQDKSAKTKMGKKRITKNLMLLEEDILERMRNMSMEWDEEDLQAIVDATQEMTDELKIDTLADDFMSKRNATEESEQRMLEYVQSMGIDNVDKLKQKLAERGFNANEWQQLVIQKGLGAGDGQGIGEEGMGPGEGGTPGPGEGLGGGMGAGFALGSLIEAIGHLDVLLGNMEEDVKETNEQARQGNSGKLVDVLEDVTGQVRELSLGTGEKIQHLIDNIQADADAVDAAENMAGSDLKVTRKQILHNLVAIIREIVEPLEVIKASLDMIKSQTMGGLNDNQNAALKLAVENADIIEQLLKKLERITAAD